MSAEYRIEFTIQRQGEGEDDFTEIGFGSSGAWGDLDACTHSIESALTHGEWERDAAMPFPDEVVAEIAAARS
jgi:hypothetical protein